MPEDVTPEPGRFFFVHLQKTAGTALRRRLLHQFDPAALYPGPGDGTPPDTTILVERVVERFAARRDEIRVVTGHFPLCTSELLGVPFTTFTVLRHPVERILSALRSQHQKDPRLKDAPLEQIYDDPMRHAILRNHMVKMFSLETHEMTAGALTEVAFTPGRLARAEQRLAGVDVVGFQEDFEGFCARLSQRYGWDVGHPVVANRTEPMDAPPSLVARIADDNADDVALYEFARTLVVAPVTATADAAETVAAATRLVAEGDAHSAIDLLVAANRVERRADLERALVQARLHAFAQLTAAGSAGPASWPPPVPDGADASVAAVSPPDLPEIGPDAIGADALAQGIVGHGSLVVRGLVGGDAVDRLVDGIDRAFAGADSFAAGAEPEETRPWFDPLQTPKGMPKMAMKRKWARDAGGVLTADAPRVLFDLLEVLADSGAVAAIKAYLGERPVLSANKCTLRRVTADSGTNWHQDGAFLGTGIRSVNVWLALSDCGVDAPGIEIVPRRLPEVLATGTHGAIFDWSVGQGLVDQVAAPAGTAMPRFAAGDALLFDDLNLHRTAVDPAMTKTRYAIESWFFAPSCYPGGQVPLVV